ncbi:hypothetical protein SPBR_04671 [Sporothrix brasiliensis 5110]|uniref:Uncharacterized protein n=1 Tax=Sporothrix brasiliensis 5110 TaxID=1398154 RepID=A0A0C2IEF4_9PEZI|nr:uncharacterized protein SPBR_04671 [Sporothrix brasiliensis 5110]KIH87626.1 hypothetical protein SPBR_04671 [Sporothrix brasiliensis 5110]
MAPQPASRCCRAVRSHLTSSPGASTSAAALDGIWITDLVLARAFSHYCRIAAPPTSTTPTRRFASNVPGPLESRRRLGKRQMTDQLSSQLSLGPGGPLLPAWGLPNAPDLREWTWSPPRRAEELSEQNVVSSRQVQDNSSRGRRRESSTSVFPAWLAGFGGEQPVSEAASPAESIEPMQRSMAAQLMFTKVHTWRESIPTLSDQDFSRQLDDICRDFRSHLALAAMTVDESREAVGLIWKGLSDKEGEHALQTNASKLYSAVLEGIRACRLLTASDYGVTFWRDLYVYVSQLLPNSSSTDSRRNRSPRVMTMALETLLATPPQFLTSVADLLPPHLCAVFVDQNLATSTLTETRNAAEESSHILTRAKTQEIADALEHIDVGQHGKFIDATTNLLVAASLPSSNSGPPDAKISMTNHTITTSSSTISGWLLTLAHMPSVRQDCLFKTMSQLQSSASQAQAETTQVATTAQTTQTTQDAQEEPRIPILAATETETQIATAASNNAWHMRSAHLGHVDLCELLLAQWISRGYVTQQVRRSFEQTMAALALQDVNAAYSHPCALAALALAVFWPKHSRGQCVALYVSLLRGLREKLGREAPDVLVESLNALLAHMQSAQSSDSSQCSVQAGLPTFPPNTFYESLAWAAGDLETAIQLHGMYTSTIPLQTPPPAQPFWNIGFWDKFANDLGTALDAGKLSPGQVSHALDLLPRSKGTPVSHAMNASQDPAKLSKSKPKSKPKSNVTYKPAKELGAATVGLIEKLAMHFALAPNLVPRRALRGVELCWAILASNTSKAEKARLQGMKHSLPLPVSMPAPSLPLASPTILRALFHLVTRDLDDAMPGRTSRLRWFLAIVARERGVKAAAECERALVRWRGAVKEHHKREAMRIRRGDWQIDSGESVEI